SMLLHELYFDCLGAGAEPMTPAMALALQANFGSVERWREEFMAMGKALGGGSGWVLLVFQPREGTLVNQWAADHTHAVAGGIPGATWHDPAQVSSWSSSLPKDKPVVVYCVYGHEVGRSTAMRLRAAGVDASFLQGGIDGWNAAGRPLASKQS